MSYFRGLSRLCSSSRRKLRILLDGFDQLPRIKKKIDSLPRRKSAKSVQEFERDYPALLLSLACSVRTGLDPLLALYRSAELFPHDSIVREELARFRAAIESGASEEEAINGFGSSVGHPDLTLLRAALILNRSQGSALCSSLQRLAGVTRQRQSFRRKVKTALAMQRLSALGIAACAIVVGLIQFSTDSGAIRLALQSPHGVRLLGVGAGLILVGLVWMTRIGELEV